MPSAYLSLALALSLFMPLHSFAHLISVEVQQTAPAPGFRFPPLRALLPTTLFCNDFTDTGLAAAELRR